MSQYAARLKALEKRLAPPEVPAPIVVWTMTERTVDPPEWAEAAIQPYLPEGRVSFVEWHQSKQEDGYSVSIDKQWYHVTEAGAEPMPEPIKLAPNPFTLTLDNPNDAGLEPV